MEVIFTFADGRIAHECRRCGGRCCKLDGFASPSADLAALFAWEPALALYSRATRTRDFVALRGVGGRCPLLTDDGRCRVHDELGYTAKPYVCKLYPANQLYQLGDTLLVDLHPDCPIERAERLTSDATRLEHAALRATLRDYEPFALARAAVLEVPEGHVAALLAAGCGARDLMARHADESVIDLAAALGAAHDGESRAALIAYAARLVRFLEGSPQDVEALARASDPDLALALPRLFFFAFAADELPPLAELLAVLPRVVVTLGWLAQQRRALGEVDAGVQAAHTLCSENLDLALWLAHLDRVPTFAREPDSLPLPLGALPQLKQLLGFVFHENAAAGLTLEQITARVGLDDRFARVTTFAALPPALWRALRLS